MIKTETIVYEQDDVVFEGVIAWDQDIPVRKPGVLITHTFWGQTDFEADKAVAIAKLGYVGFAIDIYGKGRRAAKLDEAGVLMAELNDDRSLLLQRMQLAYNVLKEHGQVNDAIIGAIGFCFGGKCVLDLARAGSALKGVVSLHGLYDPPAIKSTQPILSSVLILHGWEDPLAPLDQTIALTKELTEKNVDWQLLTFGHTGHAFTNPKAQNHESGLFYQEVSSNRAWLAMKTFFSEVFV